MQIAILRLAALALFVPWLNAADLPHMYAAVHCGTLIDVRTGHGINDAMVLIEDGTADFADHSIQPSFATQMLGLNGRVVGLSSDPKSRAEVTLTGNVDRYAPVSIIGQVNLLSATAYTDLAMTFRNMELTTFNPYSGKFAGYSITQGKLTTELRYHVENRTLNAQHHVVLDQLEFGAATESKQAVPLPIKLAVALLKDRNFLMIRGQRKQPSKTVDLPFFQIDGLCEGLRKAKEADDAQELHFHGQPTSANLI